LTRRIVCHCEHGFDAQLPDEIDISEDSAGRASILDGSFLSFDCERCGDTLRPEFDLLLRDKDSDAVIYLVPEVDRDRFLFGSYSVPEGPTVVVGFAELRERIRVLEADWETQAVEVLKYQILRRAGSASDIKVYFDRSVGDQLEFHVHGLRNGEIGVVRISQSAYQSAVGDLERLRSTEPYKTLFELPYPSIHKLEIEPESHD